MTFAVSFGEWGGLYFERSEMSWRLCLGWMAFTLLFEDLDVCLGHLVAKLAAWDAWEHAWVFGGDAAYPGRAGVTDPRETLDDLERALQGEEIEEAEDEH